MRVMTILGTRPEIIRLSLVAGKLDDLTEHVLVHTGQNYDPLLNELFFSQLGVKDPDLYMGVRADTLGRQIGEILIQTEKAIEDFRPDRVLLLGDTNSALSAIVAKRIGIPVYHMEAGNRCYDDRVPEEVNRRIIDQCSDILMPYTERARVNLVREGVRGERIFVIGNPILEVVRHYDRQIRESRVLQDLGLAEGKYFLVTAHRTENVDVPERLAGIVDSLDRLQRHYGVPVVVSTHPHTQERMTRFGIRLSNENVRFLPPFGFFDFIMLERHALCLLTDSGTVQEECAIFGRPSVTIRDVTERPETVECGSNILSGVEPEQVLTCVRVALERMGSWKAPPEYLVENVSDTVVNIVLGYRHAC